MAITLNGNGVLTGVTTIPDGIVTNDDLAGSIAVSKLATTGSASSSTFLDGSGAWASAGGGKLLAMETVVNSTRYVLSTSASWSSPFSATYTKQTATSDLIVFAFIAVHGAAGGAGVQGLYDGTTKYFSGWNYDAADTDFGNQIAIANFGTLTTGSKTIQWGWESGSGVAVAPAGTVNPNSTDDSRSGQTTSTFIFCEVEA
jgi:hypothetical protein